MPPGKFRAEPEIDLKLAAPLCQVDLEGKHLAEWTLGTTGMLDAPNGPGSG